MFQHLRANLAQNRFNILTFLFTLLIWCYNIYLFDKLKKEKPNEAKDIASIDFFNGIFAIPFIIPPTDFLWNFFSLFVGFVVTFLVAWK